MKHALISIVINFCFLLTSCSTKDGTEKKLEDYYNKDLKIFSLVNSQKILDSSLKELDSVVSISILEYNLKTVVRRSMENNLLSPKYNKDDQIKYSIICVNGNTFDINIDLKKGNENEFWNQELNLILNNNNNTESLYEFLLKNNIKIYNFKYLLLYLRMSNIYVLSLHRNPEFIKFYFTVTEGIVFIPTSTRIAGNIESTTNLERLGNNWYYFKEVF